MKYFYIIERNGTITELTYSPDAYEATFKEWIAGGRLIVKGKGREVPQGINAVDIVKIATKEDYQAYINTARPKRYIVDGTWFDLKEGKVLSYEKWKQDEIDAKKQIVAPVEKPLTPEQAKRNQRKIREIGQNLRNKFSMGAAKQEKNCIECGADLKEASRQAKQTLRRYCSSTCLVANEKTKV